MASLTQIAPASAKAPAPLHGAVRFVAPEERVRLQAQLEAQSVLWVDVACPPWTRQSKLPSSAQPQRTKLRDAIDGAVEGALQAKGAPSPGACDLSDLDQCLSDQLFRARQVGAVGFAMFLPDLTQAGNLAGALDAEDSAVLRWWLSASTERPVILLIDARNRRLGAYGPPVRLEKIVDAAMNAAEAIPPPSPSPAEPNGEHDLPASPEPTVDAAETAEPESIAATEEGSDVQERAEAPAPNRVVSLFPRREPSPREQPTKAAPVDEQEHPEPPPIDWRSFASELELAKGPKPLTIVERLFMSRYVPLLEAIGRGQADVGAAHIADAWAESFSRSYVEGFSALKVTGKRPRMVLDAPQIGSQIARLHGAKSTQLVLVDAMRFDLGVRVHDRMQKALSGQATCTERVLLWSALPTTTPAQLDLLAYGPEGLAQRGASSERDDAGIRGRTSATLRRIKLGSRDLHKLDLVEARVREPGGPLGERLDAIAEEVAALLCTHARTLAPRTLMFVFGDHGFRMLPGEGGTRPATSGGATPEEVLVPAFAWLVGDVH